MLKGENINLRALEPSDLDVLYNWENDTSIWKVSQTIAPFSKNILAKYLENAHQDIFTAKQLRLMIEKNNTAIGTIELFDFDPVNLRCGIGIWIVDEENRRKGYAKEALTLIIKYAFSNLHLFGSLDFQLVGVKSKWNKTPEGWEDELLFQLLCD